MNLTDEVIKLDCTKGSYVYAVVGADGNVTLIDTSMPGKGQAILEELDSNGFNLASVKRILLTHADIDHIGSAAFLQEKTGCEIYIHPDDYPYVMDGQKREGFRRFVSALMKVQTPREVRRIEGDAIGEFTVIPAPGHTKGHTVYRFRDVVFLGDLARGSRAGLVTSPSFFTWDRAALLNSIRTLNIDGVQWLCPAHSEPVKADVWGAFVNGLR